jgi:hypothetical protein
VCEGSVQEVVVGIRYNLIAPNQRVCLSPVVRNVKLTNEHLQPKTRNGIDKRGEFHWVELVALPGFKMGFDTERMDGDAILQEKREEV